MSIGHPVVIVVLTQNTVVAIANVIWREASHARDPFYCREAVYYKTGPKHTAENRQDFELTSWRPLRAIAFNKLIITNFKVISKRVGRPIVLCYLKNNRCRPTLIRSTVESTANRCRDNTWMIILKNTILKLTKMKPNYLDRSRWTRTVNNWKPKVRNVKKCFTSTSRMK